MTDARMGRKPNTLCALAMLTACASAPPPPPPPRPVAVVRTPPPARLDAPLHIRDAGFKTPESVLYDAEADRYLVSNVDGGPRVADHHGFISRVKPDGTVEALRFIDGERDDSALDAPKGMAIIGNVLFVADITRVRKFDRQTGRALGAIEVQGAAFLNDLCASKNGTLYASDSGLAEGYVSTKSDAVYAIRPSGEVSTVLQSASLAQPNGLACTDEGLLVTSFGRPEVQLLKSNGEVLAHHTLPKGALDGIAIAGDHVFVASWEAHAVYEAVREEGGRIMAAPVEAVSELDSPADLGLDTRRNTLLIPLFHEDALVLFPLPEREAPKSAKRAATAGGSAP